MSAGGYSLIPNQVQQFYVTQTNYTTIGATFTITGGTIVSALNGAVTVKAPATGSACGFDTTNKLVTSATNVVLKATAKDGGAAPVTLTIPVCNPPIQHDNLPAFRMGVYAGQRVDIQCIVIGSLNRGCSWSITAQPQGGDATLGDTNQRDAMFTATVPGRYVVKSTAAVDGSSATTIIDIPTSATAPYNATVNRTEPVNCAADPSLTGKFYEIGPGKAYADFTALFAAVTPGPGDTIVYTNQGAAGTPTLLHNYFNNVSQGTQAQPVFICGKPNTSGELPVLDGADATSAYPANPYFSGLGQVTFYKSGYSTTDAAYPKFIQLSGFVLQNANNTNMYYATGNGHTSHNTWGQSPDATNSANQVCSDASCQTFISAIRVQNGGDLNFIGNDIKATGLCFMTEAKGPISAMSMRILIEGNNCHDYGYSTAASAPNTGGTHGLYLQSFEEVVQGNRIGPAHSTHEGGTLKDRGVVQFIRYNFLDANDGASRVIDLVDQQDASFSSPNMWINQNGTSGATDPGWGWDALVAWQEAFYDESWVYGNVIRTLSSYGPIHFNGDHGIYGLPRTGRLHFYNNTLQCLSGNNTGCAVADPADPNGPTWAFPAIDMQNSIVWNESGTLNYLRNREGTVTAVSLFSPLACCTNDQLTGGISNTGKNSGWPLTATKAYGGISSNIYADYDNIAAHISGYGTSGSPVPNVVATRPFDTTTYASAAVAGTVLPAGYLPVRLMFRPDLGYVIPRGTVVTTSVAGTAGGVDSGTAPAPAVAPASTTSPTTTTTTTTTDTTTTTSTSSTTPTTPPPPNPTPAPTPLACSVMGLGQGASLNGFLPFEAANAWRQNIAAAAVDANSPGLINFLGASHLFADFGAGQYNGSTIGIPFTVVSGAPFTAITYTAYGAESDPGPMPFQPSTAIEGYPNPGTGDRHALVLDRDNCWLYELFGAYPQGDGTWQAASGAVWDLLTENARPIGWTSVDAAGLPVFPGLVRYEEVAAGHIDHAIRMTLQSSKAAFVAPATHWAANSTNANAAPMGMRMRLKASFDISSYGPQSQVILTALKNYGMIMADNGSNMYMTGSPDDHWDNNDLQSLKQVPASAFEVVQTGTLYTSANLPKGTAPAITSLTASATTVAAGTSVILTWAATNASYFVVSPEVGAVRGNTATVKPTKTTTYTLYATGPYGQTTQTITINVQ